MLSNLEDWETQQVAGHAAAHKDGPLDFFAGGGVVASRREQEERRVSDALAHEVEEHHKKLVEASMKGLPDATLTIISYTITGVFKSPVPSADGTTKSTQFTTEVEPLLWRNL